MNGVVTHDVYPSRPWGMTIHAEPLLDTSGEMTFQKPKHRQKGSAAMKAPLYSTNVVQYGLPVPIGC